MLSTNLGENSKYVSAVCGQTHKTTLLLPTQIKRKLTKVENGKWLPDTDQSQPFVLTPLTFINLNLPMVKRFRLTYLIKEGGGTPH